ncbi:MULTISPECIES: putative FMN-dependent luciferase-like monooxygenase [Microbacterium]|uniref:putative FMN-dependent luciferase-like monooxygenase n=1 Tax=Microbacterium TaxID=33882 RepID=UPI00278439C3|nr:MULTISPECIES: putative FMN-dependent luciferase-like monooxygenase [Microbacterium]MDQ1082104.1 putative FMN-dependent luciferase-like monooxygenase [Microbacterium sp. SORGH_AS_0344]MDQ1169129.1 putative FMN-dependent luciferase-like monooxygenase [Microbacterium proteolyticum]
MNAPRLGFFSRVLEHASAADRYRFAVEQIAHAERSGFASAWIAQHHFGENEGGMPSPFVLLAAAAQRTSRIALATGVVTLPLDDPLRVAEDAAVLDQLSGGRVQLGLATGGTPSSFAAFGRESDRRREIFADHLEVLLDALEGRGVRGSQSRIYPHAGDLSERIWQATFSVDGGRRAGQRGDGLLLSRTQPRAADAPSAPLHDLQLPIIEAYRASLPHGAPVRVLASRTALVVDPENRTRALELAGDGLRHLARTVLGIDTDGVALDDLVRLTDTHVGTVDEVVASLSADRTLAEASDVSFQVHSIAATHELTLRSLELLADEVAPRLGFAVGPDAATDLQRAHRPFAAASTSSEGPA